MKSVCVYFLYFSPFLYFLPISLNNLSILSPVFAEVSMKCKCFSSANCRASCKKGYLLIRFQFFKHNLLFTHDQCSETIMQ